MRKSCIFKEDACFIDTEKVMTRKAPVLSQSGGSCTTYATSIPLRLHGVSRSWRKDWKNIREENNHSPGDVGTSFKENFEYYRKKNIIEDYVELHVEKDRDHAFWKNIFDTLIKSGIPIHFNISTGDTFGDDYTFRFPQVHPISPSKHSLTIVGYDDDYYCIQDSRGTYGSTAHNSAREGKEGAGYFRIRRGVLVDFGDFFTYAIMPGQKDIEIEEPSNTLIERGIKLCQAISGKLRWNLF